MSDGNGRPVLDPRTYRWADRLTKLGGVALVAIGLEVGGQTPVGLALGVAGAVLALCTVFVDNARDADSSTDE